MPLHSSYDIYLEADGVRLQEYDVVFDGSKSPPTVSCWIPSESGKSFVIKCMNMQVPRLATRYIFDLDGVRVDTRINRADHGPFAQVPATAILSALSTTRGRHDLAFAELELTDDDEALNRQPNASLGEISVQVQRTTVTDLYRPEYTHSITLSAGRVHERSKKAGAHSIGLGPVSTAPEPWTVSTMDIGSPILVFIFRYRPLALLQAQGIAPRPAPASSPTPALRPPSPDVEIKDKRETDDVEEDEEIRRLQARIASLKKRKRATEPKVKSEPAAQRPRTSGGSNEVIDLTAD